ncbi:MAG: hypothetical protein E6R04_10070 [Spirochaetes bacterium]|nr:MAG: hypothetical protein E6R04_10070 [Spirochaetota bacterium]
MNQDRDNVAGDLLQILDDVEIKGYAVTALTKNLNARILDKDLLMQKLCSYVARRDSKVFNHAYQLGKEKNEQAKEKQA